MNVLFNYSGTSASREPMSARAWFDESETALADRPSLAPLHVVHRETSFLVPGNLQEKWRAPRRKLSAGARTVPTLRGQRPDCPSHRRASFSIAGERKSTTSGRCRA